MQSSLTRSMLLLSTAAALSAIPSLVRAQDGGGASGFFVGLGGGVGRVGEPNSHVAKIAPTLHLHAGWAFTPTLGLVVEGSVNAIGSFRVDSAALDPRTGTVGRTVRLQTESLLASLQVGSPRTFYVRPGIGFARHAFATLEQREDAYLDATSFEWGLAAGVAAGREVSVIPGFPLNVEAVTFWSSGEDSTSPRWSAAVQVVREIRF